MNVSKEPFPHIVIDDFLEAKRIKDLWQTYPNPDEDWYGYNNVFEVKYATDKPSKIPSFHREILGHFNSAPFLAELEKLFGIDGLIPDPYLRGGGLHYIKNGGKLDIHADFNIHPKLKLQRRINVLLYLNKDWRPEYGGELQLWDRTLTKCTRVDPIFNRLVAFETSSTSYHGHPTVWNAPYPRRSIATYYYTVPEANVVPHSTLYQKLPHENTTPEIEELRAKRAKGRI